MARRFVSPSLPLCPETGKRAYDSRILALDALNRLEHGRRARDEARAYLCPFCGLYHLTKQGAANAPED